MTQYQRKTLSNSSNIGSPAPLPLALVGLTDDVLADLSAFVPGAAEELGFAGQGFFPVADEEPAVSPRWIHKAVFMQRLTAESRIAIRTEAKTDPVIEDFLDVLYAADFVDLDAVTTQAGVGYLMVQDLLTPEEAAVLLA